MVTVPAATDFSAAELTRIRADFPILNVLGRDGQSIDYLDSGATSQLSLIHI